MIDSLLLMEIELIPGLDTKILAVLRVSLFKDHFKVWEKDES